MSGFKNARKFNTENSFSVEKRLSFSKKSLSNSKYRASLESKQKENQKKEKVQQRKVTQPRKKSSNFKNLLQMLVDTNNKQIKNFEKTQKLQFQKNENIEERIKTLRHKTFYNNENFSQTTKASNQFLKKGTSIIDLFPSDKSENVLKSNPNLVNNQKKTGKLQKSSTRFSTQPDQLQFTFKKFKTVIKEDVKKKEPTDSLISIEQNYLHLMNKTNHLINKVEKAIKQTL